MRVRVLVSTVATLFAVTLAASTALAATLTIDWLQMPPTPSGGSVPNGSIFNVPGIGPVTVTYSMGANVSDSRSLILPPAGSVAYGGDTYQWSNWEYFGTILNTGPDPIVPVTSTVTYTFPFQLSPGVVYVGTVGIGATTSFGGGVSTITVNQNGTFFGDFNIDASFGASAFTGNPGQFYVRNSVTGPGGQNPHWNSQLAVVRVDDYVSSVTIIHDTLRGDGIGANVGFIHDYQTAATSPSWGRIKQLYK